jgi:hypothetical protein
VSDPRAVSALPQRRGVLAILSEAKRLGRWAVPARFRAFTVLGVVRIDLTDAELGEGTTEIECFALLGEVRIIAPPGLRIECDGDGVAGEFSMREPKAYRRPVTGPLVRVTGTAVLGTVSVRIIDPNSPGWRERLQGLADRVSRGVRGDV